MAEITAASVKELRERTGAGMMDCKKALDETDGDMEAAVDWLRAKGLAAAAKKAGRTAAEGLVGVAVERHQGRGRRGQLGDRLRRQERAVPGLRPQGRRSWRWRRPADDVEALKARGLSGRRHRRGEADRQHRHDRREPVAAPHRACSRSAKASSSATSTTPPAPASARSACWSRSRARRRPTRSRRSASSSRCTSPRPIPLALDADGLDADADRA